MIRWLSALLILCSLACRPADADQAPVFVKRPTLVPNDNLRAPLAGILRFTTDQPVTTVVRLSDGSRRWELEFDDSWDPVAGIPLLGLKAEVRHEARVTIRNRQGQSTEAPDKLVLVTPGLPAGPYDRPPIRVTRFDPARMEPGLTLFAVRRNVPIRPRYRTVGQERFARGWGMLVALDETGQVVWYYQSDSRIAGIDQFGNGNILFHRADFRTFEISPLGMIVNQWYAARNPYLGSREGIAIDVQTLHHQPHEMPNGNFLALTANGRLMRDYVTNEYDPQAPRRDRMVMGDDILEVDRKDGHVLWRWSAWDHLDPYRIGYETTDPYWITRGFADYADWTHGNGITYDPRDDSVLVSFRIQDAILKIDRKSGEIKWILGDPRDWGKLSDKLLKPVGQPFRWPSHQHNPRISEAGTIVVFDNGAFRARPPDPVLPLDQRFSRGVEYEVDEKAMTVRQLWESASGVSDDSCYSNAMSDAHRLPLTGNMLVIEAICSERAAGLTNDQFAAAKHIDEMPTHGRIREYTHTNPAKVLFEALVQDPYEVVSWEVYGGLRIASLYPPGRAPKVRELP